MIRYEDLVKVPKLMFTQIVQFMEWELNEKALSWAVDQTSFGNLQRLEAEGGFGELSPNSREQRFFRRGRMQTWPVVLSARPGRTSDRRSSQIDANGGL